jgi:hypothetical protein
VLHFEKLRFLSTKLRHAIHLEDNTMTSLLIGHTLDTIVGSIECSSPFSRPPP